MENQQPNSEERRSSVNTRGVQFYNSEPVHFPGSTVQLGFWDEKYFTARFNPMKANPTEKEKFDYDSGLSTAVNPDNVLHLIDGLEKVKKAHLEGKSANCYCVISNVHVFGYGTLNIPGKGNILYLALHKDLSPETRKPKHSMYFEFPKPTFHIENYNPETGENQMVPSEFGEFAQFENFLYEARNVASKATAHSTRFVFDYMLRRLDAKVSGIMTATNAREEYQPSGGGFTRRQNVFSNASEAAKADNEPPKVEKIDGTETEELPF